MAPRLPHFKLLPLSLVVTWLVDPKSPLTTDFFFVFVVFCSFLVFFSFSFLCHWLPINHRSTVAQFPSRGVIEPFGHLSSKKVGTACGQGNACRVMPFSPLCVEFAHVGDGAPSVVRGQGAAFMSCHVTSCLESRV